jgi:hypothetical protein
MEQNLVAFGILLRFSRCTTCNRIDTAISIDQPMQLERLDDIPRVASTALCIHDGVIEREWIGH